MDKMELIRSALQGLRSDTLKAHKSPTPELLIRIGLAEPEPEVMDDDEGLEDEEEL
ncbi:hypothetical protein [Sandaracinus amylolyticus]|uniref:hypothetical protein n=1 Tax=Sandaracinus amylolyticus TaxID=927083 RepID=UPI001F2FD369|nr:hypothetical protein [Sandaracinus amylolyticus]